MPNFSSKFQIRRHSQQAEKCERSHHNNFQPQKKIRVNQWLSYKIVLSKSPSDLHGLELHEKFLKFGVGSAILRNGALVSDGSC